MAGPHQGLVFPNHERLLTLTGTSDEICLEVGTLNHEVDYARFDELVDLKNHHYPGRVLIDSARLINIDFNQLSPHRVGQLLVGCKMTTIELDINRDRFNRKTCPSTKTFYSILSVTDIRLFSRHICQHQITFYVFSKLDNLADPGQFMRLAHMFPAVAADSTVYVTFRLLIKISSTAPWVKCTHATYSSSRMSAHSCGDWATNGDFL
ncbi:hypothetical protein PRIPAC_85714 [Pristionchus pacificus]|uniref:Uncharacterized protein n=1 Tax=Pristionchus pacificus TaxID=54126 RepID=A0A2A6BS69_PRIPA|nr:hypothetical protein PRIPAC_85714 [Pristionchus pacificus]|eukprot:PDM68666.1 hypothetical protein PRIPAC_46968 [Pristionchus pacificus]